MKAVAQSQLMTNHVPGSALPAQRRVRAAYSTNHSPLLFSVDDKDRFWLTRPSDTSTTGWAQVDLTARLAALPDMSPKAGVRSFSLSQDADGALRMIVAAVTGTDADAHIYVSDPLPNSEQEIDWDKLPALLTRHAVLPKIDVVDVVMGGGPGETPFAVVAGLDPMGQVRYHQINPDPHGEWSSAPLPLPQNATKVLSVAVGRHPKQGRGVYSLLQLGELQSLMFTTLPRMQDGRTLIHTVELDLPDGLAPQCLATLPDEKGRTALYVGGDGIHHYSVKDQTTSHLPGDPLVPGTVVRGVRDLILAADPTGSRIGVWALDGGDALVHLEGIQVEATPDTYRWQPPAVIDVDVNALSAYLTRPVGDRDSVGAAMAVGGVDGALKLVVRHPQTALWQPQTVSLHTGTEALTLQTYSTRLIVNDDNDVPVANATVTVEPERDCAALVNGRHYALSCGTPKTATTDHVGVLTVVMETSDLTVPSLTFRIGSDDPVHVDPGTDTKAALRAVKSGEQIATAQRSDDRALFTAPPDRPTCDAAAAAVQQLMTAHDDLAARAAGQPGMTGAAPVAVVRSDGGWAVPSTLEPDTTAGWLQVAAGDLLAAAGVGSETMKAFTVNLAEDGWQLFVEFGDWALQCVLEAAHQAVAAIDWVLRNTLGITLEDIVAWFGFAFNWADILANHRVMVKLVTLTFDEAIRRMAGFKTTIDEQFTEVRKRISADGLVVDRSSEIFAGRVGRGAGDEVAGEHRTAGDTPQANWAQHHFDTNMSAASSDPFVPDDLGTVLGGLAATEIDVLIQAGRQLEPLVRDGLNGRPVDEVVAAIAEVVALTVVDSVENIAITTVDLGILMVASIKEILTGRWDIPVLTPFYEKVICQGDGSKLTLLDLVSLLATIPATVVGKTVTRQNLFTREQVDAVAKATDWAAAQRALNPPARFTLLAAAQPTRTHSAAQVLQLISATLRLFSCRLAIARDIGDILPGINTLLTRAKIACDWTLYATGLTATGLALPAKTSDRQRIDAAVIIAGFMPPSLDMLREVYTVLSAGGAPMLPSIELTPPGQNGPPGPSPSEGLKFADITRYVDTGYGIVVLVLSMVSALLQKEEATPPELTQAEDTALLTVKFLQNACAGLGSVLSLGLAAPASDDPDTKTAVILARAVLVQVRAYLQFGRATAQLSLYFTDLEGVVP